MAVATADHRSHSYLATDRRRGNVQFLGCLHEEREPGGDLKGAEGVERRQAKSLTKTSD